MSTRLSPHRTPGLHRSKIPYRLGLNLRSRRDSGPKEDCRREGKISVLGDPQLRYWGIDTQEPVHLHLRGSEVNEEVLYPYCRTNTTPGAPPISHRDSKKGKECPLGVPSTPSY